MKNLKIKTTKIILFIFTFAFTNILVSSSNLKIKTSSDFVSFIIEEVCFIDPDVLLIILILTVIIIILFIFLSNK